jgi:hypothetical protein
MSPHALLTTTQQGQGEVNESTWDSIRKRGRCLEHLLLTKSLQRKIHTKPSSFIAGQVIKGGFGAERP